MKVFDTLLYGLCYLIGFVGAALTGFGFSVPLRLAACCAFMALLLAAGARLDRMYGEPGE